MCRLLPTRTLPGIPGTAPSNTVAPTAARLLRCAAADAAAGLVMEAAASRTVPAAPTAVAIRYAMVMLPCDNCTGPGPAAVRGAAGRRAAMIPIPVLATYRGPLRFTGGARIRIFMHILEYSLKVSRPCCDHPCSLFYCSDRNQIAESVRPTLVLTGMPGSRLSSSACTLVGERMTLISATCG